MSNLQRASQTPSAPTLIQTSAPPASSFNPREPGRAPQTTGVNVPDAALGGTPYKSVTEVDVVKEGDSRKLFYSPKVSEIDAVTGRDKQPLPGISPRDDIAINRLVQNEQGTTNRDILNTPDNYHAAIVGENYIKGGGVNGMSPTAFGQASTRGNKQSDVTPSVGKPSMIDEVLKESQGKSYRTGDRGDQGSTEMRANSLVVRSTPDKKPSPIVPLSGSVEYAPYTPSELRKSTAFKQETPAAPAPSVTGDPAQERIRALVRRQETGSFDGDYAKKNIGHKTSASGAYQFVDKTWRNAAKDAGVGAEYKHAYMAPKEVQDKVFDHYFKGLMDRTKGDFYKAINIHFTGNPEGRLSAAGKKANPTINAQGYRKSIQNHEAEYDRLKNTVATR